MSLRYALPLALAALVGCSRASQDTSKVLANVGGHKITEQDLAAMIRIVAPSPEVADSVMKDPAQKVRRDAMLKQLAEIRQLIEFGRLEGFETTPRYQLSMDIARADATQRIWAQAHTGGIEPTQAELKAIYDEEAARQKQAGQPPLPPMDQVTQELRQAWTQKNQQRLQEEQQRLQDAFKKQVNARVPITLAD